MAEKWEAKDKLKPKNVSGISEKQIDYHFDIHYKGYVNKLNEIWDKLEKVDRSAANQNYSDYRAMKLEETFNYNGAMLHEIYFGNLTNGSAAIPSVLKAQIELDFGSYEKWLQDFKAVSTAFRGWAFLIFDLTTGKLRNIGSDAHNQYAIWNAIVLINLDVYEHAYYVDYGPKRAPYVDAYLSALNWNDVEVRLSKAKKAFEAMK